MSGESGYSYNETNNRTKDRSRQQCPILFVKFVYIFVFISGTGLEVGGFNF